MHLKNCLSKIFVANNFGHLECGNGKIKVLAKPNNAMLTILVGLEEQTKVEKKNEQRSSGCNEIKNIKNKSHPQKKNQKLPDIMFYLLDI